MCLGAYVVLSFLYIPSDSLGLLIAVRLLHGVAFGLGNTAVSATVQALLPPARRAEGTGYFMLSTSLSIAVGPLIAVQLAGGGHYVEMFWPSTASTAFGLVIGLILRQPELPAEQRPRAREVKWLRLSTMVERRAVPIAVVALFCGAAYSSILALASAYSDAEGHPGSSAWLFSAYAVSMVAPRLFAGRLQDKFGPGVVLWPAFGMFVAALITLTFSASTTTMLISGILCGFGFGVIIPSAQAVAVSASPEHRVGVAVSTFFLALDIGTGLGPVLFGAIVPLTGYAGVYWTAAGLVGLGALSFWLLRPRRPGMPETSERLTQS